MSQYKCWGCYEVFHREGGEWFCQTCMPLWKNDEITVDIYVRGGDSKTAGYAGYNEGLGIEIKNKGHWHEEVKRRGLRSVEQGELREMGKKNVEAERSAYRKAATDAMKTHGIL